MAGDQSSDPPLSIAVVDAVIAHLRQKPPADETQLTGVYRRLLKRAHPDRNHDNGEVFLYLRTAFGAYREQWIAGRRVQALTDTIDRRRILTDLGLPQEVSPRRGLLAALYRFRSLGLSSFRIRTRTNLRERNAAVLRAVISWGYEYDEHFVPVFHALLTQRGRFSPTDRHGPLYFMLRRMVYQSLDDLLRYQDRQIAATAQIAGDRLEYALRISRDAEAVPAIADLRRFALWLVAELAKPPESIGLND
jgi:hypothetical protein